MPIINKFNFANIQINIHADIKFPLLHSLALSAFISNAEPIDADFYILQFPDDGFEPLDLSLDESASLVKVNGFQKRWLKNEIINSPQIKKTLNKCINNPESSHIEMAWDRLIIRDFAHNQFYLYYPKCRVDDLMGPIFFAGLRNFISAAFPNHSALLLHGAGVTINKKAAIFLAHDGGGKTTITKCFDQKNILNDDQLIIRKETNSFLVYSTPFGSMLSTFQSSDLGGFFLLKKSNKFHLDRISKDKILEFIWNEQFFSTIILPKKIRTKQFELLSNILNSAPCYCLQFPIEGISKENICSIPCFN